MATKSADVGASALPTTPSDMGATAQSAFTRTASGLVRNMSLWDAALFGLLSTGGAYAFVYLYPLPQYLSPGASIPLLIVLTFLFSVCVWFSYAALGSAMPRAGGDFVFETRTVNRLFGFSIPWGSNLVFWLVFPTTGAYVANTLGLIPICTAFGMTGAAKWLATPLGGLTVVLVVLALQWSLAVFGLQYFRVAQRFVLFPFVIIGSVTMIVVLALNWGTNFRHAFNVYNKGTGITYGTVHAAAIKSGYAPVGFSLIHTLEWFVLLAGIIPFTMFAAQGMLGEVKQASNLKRLFNAFLLPGIGMAFILLLLPWLLMQHVVGSGFLNQFATAYGAGAVHPAYAPNINIFVEMLAPSKWVVLLISLGFIGGGFGIAAVAFLNAGRVMMAMSLDRLLPAFLSKVSQRYYTPLVALTVWTLIAVPVGIWFNYGKASVTILILNGAMITAVTVITFTMLGAALFPFTAKGIYASAPAKRLTLFGLPMVTIVGTIGLVMIVPSIIWAMFNPNLGVTSLTSRITLLGAYASGFIFYGVWQLLERRRGVDVALIAREVPPE